MAKGTVPKRELTNEELEDAARLNAAWLVFKKNKNRSQAWIGKETELGNQTLISQYITGQIPLNPKAVLAFARVFDIRPSEISPRTQFPDMSLTPDEFQLIKIYRSTADNEKLALLRLAQAHATLHPIEQASIEDESRQNMRTQEKKRRKPNLA